MIWLNRFRDPYSRIARWRAKLQPYDLFIRYHPGHLNDTSDLLSRHITPVLSPKQWWKHQNRDTETKKLLDQFKQGRLRLIEGILHRELTDRRTNEKRWNIVAPLHVRATMLHEAHDQSSHSGIERTMYNLKRRYWWPKMKHDVRNYVLSCKKCLNTWTPTRHNAPSTPINSTYFGHILAMDIKGPITPITKEGYQYILVLQDHFSKWTDVIYLKSLSARETVSAVEAYLHRSDMEIPSIILTDRGTNFIAQEFINLCRKYGIQKRTTTARNPQSNGSVERFNREISNCLQKLSNSKLNSWPAAIKNYLMIIIVVFMQAIDFHPFNFDSHVLLAHQQVFLHRLIVLK